MIRRTTPWAATVLAAIAAGLVTGCPPAEPAERDAGLDASLLLDAPVPDARDALELDAAEVSRLDAGLDAGPPDAVSLADACPAPTRLCGSLCVDLTADPDHCGACDMRCVPRAGSIPFCGASRCVNAVCRPGFGNCDGDRNNGCEVDVDTSVEHCGFCTNACPAAPHAIPGCADALCTLACEPGWHDCEPTTPGCECEASDAGP